LPKEFNSLRGDHTERVIKADGVLASGERNGVSSGLHSSGADMGYSTNTTSYK